MRSYLVEWIIDEEADSPLEAARKALEAQRNPDTIALVFNVTDKVTGKAVEIDLTKYKE